MNALIYILHAIIYKEPWIHNTHFRRRRTLEFDLTRHSAHALNVDVEAETENRFIPGHVLG